MSTGRSRSSASAKYGSSAGSFGGTPVSCVAISPMPLNRPAAYARLSVSRSGLPGCRMKGAAMKRPGAAATHCGTTAGLTPLRKALTMFNHSIASSDFLSVSA